MPALAFGLKPTSTRSGASPAAHAGIKRKSNLFVDDDSDDSSGRAPKSPKHNLASTLSSKHHASQAAELDSSVYDYDALYDTFHAPKESTTTAASGPKYMTSLLQSAELRKRDQLRAKERLLQRERELEGDEFADKEKFVTGAYKTQMEEVKRLEEEEREREAREEERRKRGEGMTAFNKRLLEKDEERSRAIERAVEEKAKLPENGPERELEAWGEDDENEAKLAAELNAQGAHVTVNDDGEVVDKRQLLSAGLNVARKPKPAAGSSLLSISSSTGPSRQSTNTTNARQSQRERQTRMLAAQLEDMAAQQAAAETAEQRSAEEKVKSTKTASEIQSARERALARRREREEAAKKAAEKNPT